MFFIYIDINKMNKKVVNKYAKQTPDFEKM